MEHVHSNAPKHVVSAGDFDAAMIEKIFAQAAYLKHLYPHRFTIYKGQWNGFANSLRNHVFNVLFYEASTRTRISFESAIEHLGGSAVHTENAREFSSVTKGETLDDSIRVIAGYGCGIILRHNERGAAEQAANVSTVSIFNGGDGDGEHPTQALLDLFTMVEKFQESNELTIAFVGDNRYSRAVRSLVELSARLKNTSLGKINKYIFVNLEKLAPRDDMLSCLKECGLEYECHTELQKEIIERCNIVYMTRSQLERWGKIGRLLEYASRFFSSNGIGSKYALTEKLAESLPGDSIILHPLPRNAEIPVTIDHFPQATYFEQAHNGLFVRMALLLWVYNRMYIPPDFSWTAT